MCGPNSGSEEAGARRGMPAGDGLGTPAPWTPDRGGRPDCGARFCAAMLLVRAVCARGSRAHRVCQERNHIGVPTRRVARRVAALGEPAVL